MKFLRAFISIIRIAIFGAWSFFCILLGTFLSIITLSRRATIFTAKYIWPPVSFFIMGARFKVHGRKFDLPKVSYVVVSNHSSYLDIPAITSSIPLSLRFIAKKEFKHVPFLGWYLWMAETIMIDRKNTAAAKESLKIAANYIANGHHVAIYPEGTSSHDGTIKPFKKGAFHLAEDAKAHILPVRIDGAYHVWPSARKLDMRMGTIDVIIGDPIPPEVYLKMDIDERTEFVRQTIVKLKK
ncbi:MAG: 1-acyl-sn-glycerol-3-phosphate acyltransferase [Crocinitomicaceae bacterium]|nr:1-acyl-sn-glycerol-3-phosphate acyltransferase [Crocinitomicaceae bacterium]MBK8925120.1 1-acyl-sn-glycerol-3-phosphate acyltransferase [Crocinitomicaceae bacterium]